MFVTSTHIQYNGLSSESFGIIVGKLNSSGEVNYQTGINTEHIINKVKFIDEVFYYGTEKIPLEFELELYKETPFTITDRLNLHTWLYSGTGYCDLIFNNPDFEETIQADMCEDIVFSCMPVGKMESVNLGQMFGVKLTFLCNKPYPTTKETIQRWDLSDNSGTVLLDPPLVNRSNLNEYFWDTQLEIRLKGSSTGVTLTNLSDIGYSIQFSNLNTSEIITLKNKLGLITSSTGLNRLDKWNFNFLRLVAGVNHIQVTGACEIILTAKYPIII